MLGKGLSRQYSNGPALNGGRCRRGQEQAEGRKVQRCHSFKVSVSIFGSTAIGGLTNTGPQAHTYTKQNTGCIIPFSSNRFKDVVQKNTTADWLSADMLPKPKLCGCRGATEFTLN